MKMWWSLLLMLGVTLSMMTIIAQAESDLLEENDDGNEILVRMVRGTKERTAGGGATAQCRYVKGQWSECDPKTNMRTRTLNLKKGEKTCEETKVIEKKCKKACRYEKGAFGGCVNMSMTRVDKLKTNSDPTCDGTRRITKKCKPEIASVSTKKGSKGADRGNRKTGNKQ